MQIESEKIKNNYAILYLKGKLDSNAENIIKEEVNKFIKKKKNIIMDLSKISYINSSGLGILVSVLKKAKSENLKLHLVNLQSYVEELINSSQLDRIFSIKNNIKDVIG
ncbi:MAG: STAS domain-containing protein [Kosmotoga sp.]|nr:MAG: STAS domain-containing protein [Kosmotoga sp.]